MYRKVRVMSGLVDCDTIQIISMIISAGSGLDICNSGLDALWLKLRSTAALPQTLCNSSSEVYRVCLQKMYSLHAEFCRSRATEDGSRKLYVLIELTNLLWIFRGKLGNPQHPLENNYKGKQGWYVWVRSLPCSTCNTSGKPPRI